MGFSGALFEYANNRDRYKREAKTLETAKYSYPQSGYCQIIENHLTDLNTRISELYKDVLSPDFVKKLKAQDLLPILKKIRSDLSSVSAQSDCKNKIESKKLQETADIIGNEVKKYDEDVLKDSSKQRNTLLAIGGVILLSALAMVLTFNKKK